MEIPVIDFSQLDGENRSKTLAQLHHACEKWGFLKVKALPNTSVFWLLFVSAYHFANICRLRTTVLTQAWWTKWSIWWIYTMKRIWRAVSMSLIWQRVWVMDIPPVWTGKVAFSSLIARNPISVNYQTSQMISGEFTIQNPERIEICRITISPYINLRILFYEL